MGTGLSPDQLLLVTLLLRIGVIASLAGALLKMQWFKRILFKENKSLTDQLKFTGLLSVLLAFGVGVRIVVGYQSGSGDLSLVGTLLIGLMAGLWSGVAAGCTAGLVAAFLPPAIGPGSSEILAIPMGILYGLTGGSIRKFSDDKEEIWNFSPLVFRSLWKFLKSGFKTVDRKITIFASCVFLELLRMSTQSHWDERIFSFSTFSDDLPIILCVLLTTVSCLGVSLNIWNSSRRELLLEQQKALTSAQAVLLMEARFEALKNQINPHFLFNTLNSIKSSIRSNPQAAGLIVLKLSSILRRILNSDTDFVPLKEELDLIDAYLDIETIRFGDDKLKVVKAIQPDVLNAVIPTMALQPIVENSVKHGISPKIEGGTIKISAWRENGKVLVSIEDDGPGISQERLPGVLKTGIGISNVNERLKLAFGEECQLEVVSRQGAGTQVVMWVPEDKGKVEYNQEMMSVGDKDDSSR